jgi:hypothetical protein
VQVQQSCLVVSWHPLILVVDTPHALFRGLYYTGNTTLKLLQNQAVISTMNLLSFGEDLRKV